MSKDVWMRSAKHGYLWFLMIIFVLVVFAVFSYNNLTVEESVGGNEGSEGAKEKVESRSAFEVNE